MARTGVLRREGVALGPALSLRSALFSLRLFGLCGPAPEGHEAEREVQTWTLKGLSSSANAGAGPDFPLFCRPAKTLHNLHTRPRFFNM